MAGKGSRILSLIIFTKLSQVPGNPLKIIIQNFSSLSTLGIKFLTFGLATVSTGYSSPSEFAV